jgi:(S)-ureidoglycine aminohydrolase
MYNLGHTRSSFQANHCLITPDTFVRAPLPGMERATAIVHVSPVMGAGFTQYTAELEAGGTLGPASGQRFIYVVDGEIGFDLNGKNQRLQKDGYLFAPGPASQRIVANAPSRLAVIEKSYRPLNGTERPTPRTGDEASTEAQPLMGDEALQVRVLMSDDHACDFAVNTMTYQPGATLPMVEAHVMEHGCLMLAGGGIYRLGDRWYPVAAGDFIWMGPYCPQWFGALGKTPAKYLIYKDWNRHPLA